MFGFCFSCVAAFVRQFSYWLEFYFYLTLMLTGFLAPLVPKLKVKSFFVKHSSNKQRWSEWRKFIRSNCFRKRIKLVLLSCYTALFSVLHTASLFLCRVILSWDQHSNSNSTHYENAEDFVLTSLIYLESSAKRLRFLLTLHFQQAVDLYI